LHLSAKKLLQTPQVLIQFINRLPTDLLYLLVDLCLKPPKIQLTFKQILQNWPLTSFDVANLSETLDSSEFILVLSLIQKGYPCKTKTFDFVGKLTCTKKEKPHLFEITSSAILQLLLGKTPLLSKDNYITDALVSHSYTEAIRIAKGSKHNKQITDELKKSIRKQKIMNINISVDSTNVDSILLILKRQLNNEEKVLVRLKVVCLFFEGLYYLNIMKVLQILDKDFVFSIDLSFNIFTDKNHFALICKELKKFHKLKTLCLSYNSIKADNMQLIADCIDELEDIYHVDLSANYLFDNLKYLPRHCFQNILSLNISNCAINKDIVQLFIENVDQFQNLKSLNLSYNTQLRRAKKVLSTFLGQLVANLYSLDISSCFLESKTLVLICNDFVKSKNLTVFKLWPNNTTDNIVGHILYPILADVNSLRVFPPILNNEHTFVI